MNNDNSNVNSGTSPKNVTREYQIDNKKFIVESIFSDSGESLGAILLRLMKEDNLT